jgi:hypothetical protein
MKSLLKTIALAAVTALCIAAPAGATVNRTPPIVHPVTGNLIMHPGVTVNAAGTVLSNGVSGSKGYFRIDLHKGPGWKVVFHDAASNTFFRSLSFSTIAYLPNAVKITGVGLVNGKKVHFTATAIAHDAGNMVDRFGITWNHKARIGGALKSGNVMVTVMSV